MTKEHKAKIGVRCHNGGNCEKCPYCPPKDIILDPRIDPDYGTHVMQRVTGCRDKLIADLAALVGE